MVNGEDEEEDQEWRFEGLWGYEETEMVAVSKAKGKGGMVL